MFCVFLLLFSYIFSSSTTDCCTPGAVLAVPAPRSLRPAALPRPFLRVRAPRRAPWRLPRALHPPPGGTDRPPGHLHPPPPAPAARRPAPPTAPAIRLQPRWVQIGETQKSFLKTCRWLLVVTPCPHAADCEGKDKDSLVWLWQTNPRF